MQLTLASFPFLSPPIDLYKCLLKTLKPFSLRLLAQHYFFFTSTLEILTFILVLVTFRKVGGNAINRFKSNQKLLFKAETVINLRPLEKYEILFSFLDTSPLKILYLSTGRSPIPYEALLKALVYKNIKNVSYLSDLLRELKYNPDLALVFGFHPLHLTYVENFFAFLGDTENRIFQKVRDSLVSKLIELKEIKGTHLTFDSSNIPVKVKENNLKTSIKDRFDKTKKPKGDPESRFSIMVHFPKPFQKEIKYFWGYRNFVLSDALFELPILVEIKPANVVDSKIIISQLKFAKDRFDLSICAVIVDSGLDSTKVLNFIIRDLKAKPYIARNLRREKDHKISLTDNRIYLAVFEMWSRTYLLSLDASPVYLRYRLFCLYSGT